MKKNRFKSWLIKVLRNWLAKLEPYHNVVKVEHTHVPLVTVEASVAVSEDGPWIRNSINEILANKLGEEMIHYANIEWCDKYDSPLRYDRIYRAIVRVAADKRG